MFTRDNPWGAVILIFITVSIVLLGQTMWKSLLKRLASEDQEFILWHSWPLILKSPLFWLGGVTYIVATVMLIFILSIYDFSIVTPLSSMGYILALLIGRFVFCEPLNLAKIAGVVLIIFGVFFLTRSF
jgi:multidrug transporter EmrE-like cation transporter